MRTVTVIVLSMVASLAAVSADTDDGQVRDILEKQQKVLRLLYHVQQPTLIPEEREIAKTFKPIDHVDNYKDKEAVEVFWKYYTRLGFLPRGEVFSVYYEKHLAQVKCLFDLLYFAKDFDTFYKTAVWAKQHINEGMFVYTFTVVLLHRDDSRLIKLPPPYEIYPQLFVNADVIQKAYDVRLRGEVSTREQPYIFYANYSGHPVANNREELVSYFTEDVGLNSMFSYLHYVDPFWLKLSGFDLDLSGVTFVIMLQHLLALYYLERLSNNLPDIKPIDYKHPVMMGYYPELRLQNGREAQARPEGLYPRNIDILYVEEIENYERRIRDAIDLGFLSGPDNRKYDLRDGDRANTLGNVIEGNAKSINPGLYGSVYRNLISLFGHIVDPVHKYGVPPSVLEQPQTQLRDPLFYRIVKRVLSIFNQYGNKLRPYTKSEIGFPGVKVDSIIFDKLVTYFEDFDFEINNAVPLPNPEEGSKVHFLARQKRLNHKPFAYHLKVKSDKDVKAEIRVLIGPKYDVYGRELSLEERRNYYHLLDMFQKNLVPGENYFKRHSEEFPLLAGEDPHFSDLYNTVEEALKDLTSASEPQERPSRFAFPQRLALPRGTRSGLPLSVFVYVMEANKHSNSNITSYLPNFPFDRRTAEIELDVSNVRFDETHVFFRHQQDINSSA